MAKQTIHQSKTIPGRQVERTRNPPRKPRIPYHKPSPRHSSARTPLSISWSKGDRRLPCDWAWWFTCARLRRGSTAVGRGRGGCMWMRCTDETKASLQRSNWQHSGFSRPSNTVYIGEMLTNQLLWSLSFSALSKFAPQILLTWNIPGIFDRIRPKFGKRVKRVWPTVGKGRMKWLGLSANFWVTQTLCFCYLFY